MKLISTDFSNLGKKTLYDFGDNEAIDELLKEHKSTRDEITRDFFKAIEKEFDRIISRRSQHYSIFHLRNGVKLGILQKNHIGENLWKSSTSAKSLSSRSPL